MKLLVDTSFVTMKWAMSDRADLLIDRLATSDVLFCMDSIFSIRKDKYSWYKSNRGDKLAEATKILQAKSKHWRQWILNKYPEMCRIEEGLEADDVIAQHLEVDNIVMTEDKDALQHPTAYLINHRWEPWGCDRLKTALTLKQGESFLTWQLLHGCQADTIPRTIFSRDRSTIPYCLSQPSPLRAALSFIPEELARQSLNCLLMPTPLFTDEDAISCALRRYPIEAVTV